MAKVIRQSKIYDAIDIANHILTYTEGKRRCISNLMLQKFLFVQAQFLITYGEPCFRDPILAWDSGPIVKSVYDEYKFFGAASIIPDIKTRPVNTVIQLKDAQLINEIVDLCEKYSPTTLLHIIHGQMPWKQGRIRPNNHIINEDLYKFFSE